MNTFIKNFCKSTIKQHAGYSRLPSAVTASSASNMKYIGTLKRYNQTVSSSQDESGPSLATAKSMNTSYKSMDNLHLIILANLDSPPVEAARIEVLKRHIMSADESDYQTACAKFSEIEQMNKDLSRSLTLPYKLGIFTATTAGLASFPLCFHLDTAKWFNTHFVTTDVPGVEDLETMLEVGAWTWNWMEPPLGQISFFLLCLQFSRAQINHIGIKPYTERLKASRAEKLCSEFDNYDENIVTAYSESSTIG